MGKKKMQHNENNNGGGDGGGKKQKGSDVNVVVPKIDMHFENCAGKVVKAVRTLDGVESARISGGELNKLKVIGNLDPVKKKVEVISPATKKTNDGEDGGGDITCGGKRKFSWFVSSWKREDEINKRAADGSLLPLVKFSGEIIENGETIDPNADVPEHLLTKEMLDFWSAIADINSNPYYDPERYALGSLTRQEFMLLPSNLPIKECPIDAVGGGLSKYNPGFVVISGVYCLAKDQARDLGMPEPDWIKWACLRVEAFKSGWFDHQKYTVYKPMPHNSISRFRKDFKEAKPFLKEAWSVCMFLPFFAEYYFRAFGQCYNNTSASEYVSKAQRLANGAALGYMNQDLLYGKVLTWIGVKRVMQVLQNSIASQYVPIVFRIRASAAPAGQAIVTTSATVIDELRSLNWWVGIARAGNYDETTLMAVANEIRASPWKFHMMSSAYGLPPLTDEEQKRVEEARMKAQTFAPILQAYIDSSPTKTDLGNAQALKKYAMNNYAFYSNALGLFRHARRQRRKNGAALVANTVFGVPARR